jgi:hypothetical protein
MKNNKSPIILAALAIAAAYPLSPAQSPPGYPVAAAPAAPVFTAPQLQDLVGRIALYPDDLLALMLPAATTPLEIVKAQRFLANSAKDKNLKPDPSLSQPVMNLLTYPDVITFMGDDLDWTQALGQAVTSQQSAVLDAIQIFRRKAQAAGNLNSDDKQIVVIKEETVQIVPAKPEVIYVPQYQAATVVVTQAAPVVTYAATPYPAYYNPAATVATAVVAGAAIAYGLNWASHSVYACPYGAYNSHLQEERMDYANNAREDWQRYNAASRANQQNQINQAQSQRQNAAAANQGARQDNRTTNQGQRQEAAGGKTDTAQRPGSATPRPTASSMPQGAQNWQSTAQSRPATGTSQYRQSPATAQTRPSAGSSQAAATNRAAGASGFSPSSASGRSASQFGSAPANRSSAGAYGGASSGSRAQSYSSRGSQSMSSMQRSSGATRSAPSGGGGRSGGRSGGGGGRSGGGGRR